MNWKFIALKKQPKEFYIMDHQIESTEVDKFLELKISRLFSLMQEAATIHLEALGMGKSTTVDIGKYWVITRNSVDIKRIPIYMEKIQILTYIRKCTKFIFQRNFIISDANGNHIIKAASLWCVLNKETHSMDTDPFPDKIIPTFKTEDELTSPVKIQDTEIKLSKTRVSKYTDLDLHGHISNIRYIDYVIDFHDESFYDRKRIIHFDINYERELMADSIFSINSDLSMPETYSLQQENMVVTKVKIDYIDR